MSEWISVEDRLPEYSRRKLLVIHDGQRKHVEMGARVRTDSTGEHYNQTGSGMAIRNVTHWQELPEPPQ